MTETEFDILDELYFVTAFSALAQRTGLPEETLYQNLKNLASRKFIKCLYPDPDTEIAFDEKQFEVNYRDYAFLATKEGLLSHNSR